MDDFFKYLNINESDEEWGLYLTVAGRKRVNGGEPYPNPAHPTGYFFSWHKGRVLQEYQINYITDGAGVLETHDGVFQLKKGSLFILKPGMWHRYKPDDAKGWVENYIGFNGGIAVKIFNNDIFKASSPVRMLGEREELVDTFIKIFDLTRNEAPGFQQIAAGLIMKMAGYLAAFEKQKGFSGNRVEKIIGNARFAMQNNLTGELDIRQLARDNNVGYAYFRKMFKKYMGVSPLRYHLNLRIMRSRELLLTSDKSINEISDELGFTSVYYFSRLFKNKTGLSPTKFRKQNGIG
jgi:AraC-like DNA-binding protein